MIYQPRIEQSDWSEVTSHGTTEIVPWLVTCSIGDVYGGVYLDRHLQIFYKNFTTF